MMRVRMLAAGVCAAVTMLSAACSAPGQPPASAPAAVAPAEAADIAGVAPKNALVTLLPPSDDPPMPTETALIDQISKQFIPNTLIVRVGQPVDFHNGEDLPHNVTVTRRISGSEVFNVSTERAQKYTHTFDRVGQYDVKCDIHEGMEATIIVAKGPATTIAGDDGTFSFTGVTPGRYRISITFEGQTVEQPIDVSAPQTRFTFSR
ncbi:MAG: plastocyanin/azurin family copper-binding protein [Acidimicrobiia bacterium]